MTIILGFGKHEKEQEIIIKENIQKYGLEKVRKEMKEKAEYYDKQTKEEAPERYTYFYFYDNTIVFFHINRKHPFSDDGWALLIVEEKLLLKESEG